MGGRGGFEGEVEDGCGRLMDKAVVASLKRRRSQKRDKATTNNDDNRQYTNIRTEYGGCRREMETVAATLVPTVTTPKSTSTENV